MTPGEPQPAPSARETPGRAPRPIWHAPGDVLIEERGPAGGGAEAARGLVRAGPARGELRAGAVIDARIRRRSTTSRPSGSASTTPNRATSVTTAATRARAARRAGGAASAWIPPASDRAWRTRR